MFAGEAHRARAPRPYALVAELTHRCALRCPYCSNPTELVARAEELETETWRRLLDEAEELGVVQVHFTGGEPLLRDDLEQLVARALEVGLYTNLVTSAVPLTRARLERLAHAGLDHVQVSLQSSRPEGAGALAGLRNSRGSREQQVHAAKLDALGWASELGLATTMNVVLHRENVDEVDELVALAERARVQRLELANAQFAGWALTNREALLPSPDTLARAAERARAHRERLRGKLDVLFVKPDQFGTRPRACVDGWARRVVVVAPNGLVLPCHAATSISSLTFESARDRPLGALWRTSAAIDAFRGEDWMPEPCRSCDERAIDFGGCRCQAFALTGDARATDPACARSPHRARMLEVRAAITNPPEARRFVLRAIRAEGAKHPC